MKTLLTWLFRLVFALMGMVFLVGLLMAVAVYTLWALLRWLVTGRKPQVAMVWQQYSAMRKQFASRAPGQRTTRPRASNDDVIDVQARDVDAPKVEDKRLH